MLSPRRELDAGQGYAVQQTRVAQDLRVPQRVAELGWNSVPGRPTRSWGSEGGCQQAEVMVLHQCDAGAHHTPIITYLHLALSVQTSVSGAPQERSGIGANLTDVSSMVQGWSSLRADFASCRSTFQKHAPVETALQAANLLVSNLLKVNNRYGGCADFRTRLTQFFLAFEFVLRAGQEHYPDVWGSQFKAIFAGSAPAFTSLRGISASLQIDLGAVLRQVQVNPRVFLSVDLDITRLLGVNLSLGAGGLFQPSS
ncbi:hypothetical protein VP01_519g6 [Puccinia sorghi]|uniref:Uncharacterized protein n=1 Tax=Puccinia sorghi TaxID=27349 RepID=A0A0L6ULG8_9BASI|nr:hypothetical protein VP01_519g6 [Puccinia sorghi]